MTGGALLPLREACAALGISPKAVRNAWAKRRAGLPAGRWAGLEAVRVNGRLYVTREVFERFKAALAAPQAPAPGSLAGALLELAEDLERREPGAALRLRHLAELAAGPALRVLAGGHAPAEGAGT